MLNFLDPSAFIYLLLIPLIIILYFLKLRKTKYIVSANFLWESVVQDERVNDLFQKPKKNLLLLLQILILLIIIFALARPFILADTPEQQNIILLIDASASMKATDVLPTRFDAAKSEALRIIQELDPEDTAMIIKVTSNPRIKNIPTSSKSRLNEIINELACDDTTANIQDGLITALSIAEKRKGQNEIIILSDNVNSIDTTIKSNNTKIHFISFGKRAENAGIVGFDTRPTTAGYEIFASIQNYGIAREFNVELWVDDKIIDVKKIKMNHRDTKSVVFNLNNLNPKRQIIKLKIDTDDDLKADNNAYLILPERKAIKVLMAGSRNLFLESALFINPDVNVTYLPDLHSMHDFDNFDIIVFHNFAVSPEKLNGFHGGLLLINTIIDNYTPVKSFGKTDRTNILKWERKHEIMRFVDLNEVNVARAHKVSVLDWGQSLVDAEETSLIVSGENDVKAVFIGFDLQESDFPLRTAFPVLISNIVDWMHKEDSIGSAQSLHTGSPIKLKSDKDKAVSIITAENKKISFEASSEVVVDKDTVGLYKVLYSNGKEDVFAANLLNLEETNTTPTSSFTLGESKIESEAAESSIKKNKELWRYLIPLALAVLLIEWFVFHKRRY